MAAGLAALAQPIRALPTGSQLLTALADHKRSRTDVGNLRRRALATQDSAIRATGLLPTHSGAQPAGEARAAREPRDFTSAFPNL